MASAKAKAKIIVVRIADSASGLRPKASTALLPIIPMAKAGKIAPTAIVKATDKSFIESADIF